MKSLDNEREREEVMRLSELQIGKTATILSVGGSGALRQHFLDMGLIQGTEVTVMKYAPMGDPIELRIHGYELTIRLEDAKNIEISEAHPPVSSGMDVRSSETPHPGYGEGGKYHNRKNENPLPEDEVLTFALVGNQNCGKTTLFIRLTGAKQHVGNFPGVTVDRKDGVIRGHKNTLITDLPGIYSMSPYSNEEIVTREFILREKPRGIINIVDATNIERNMYLTMQLMELGFPMVIALNMMDEVVESGNSIDVEKLSAYLKVPVVPISASKNEGIDDLISVMKKEVQKKEIPNPDFCKGEVHRAIHAIAHIIEDHAKEAGYPTRFASTKLVEGDEPMQKELSLHKDDLDFIEKIVSSMEDALHTDREAALADMRYSYIEEVVAVCVNKKNKSYAQERSEKLDRILTHKYLGIPLFLLIMLCIFYLTFGPIGGNLQALLEQGIDWTISSFNDLLVSWNISEWLRALLIDGVCQGVGSVLSFLPVIVVLFFFLSLLEDSGYMAPVAFVMDKALRKIG